MSMVVQYGWGRWFSLRPGDQERGRLPSNRGSGGTGESFSGEHGLRARALVSAVKAAKEDDKLRVCSGVSILTTEGSYPTDLRNRRNREGEG